MFLIIGLKGSTDNRSSILNLGKDKFLTIFELFGKSVARTFCDF